MTPERWQHAKEIFGRALEYDPPQRSAFLSNVCGEDQAMRREIEALIAAHQEPGSFIDSPAYEIAAEMLASNEEISPGKRVGHYEVLTLLGKGGMGEVYLALDSNLRRRVALKFLPSSFTKDSYRLQRFEQEARAASALNHPNILTIHEIGEAEGRRFIATEYIKGETLSQRIEAGRLTAVEALHIAEQIASALAEAHAAAIVHRDIKPDNVMLRSDGVVKVLDFGLAKLTEEEASGPVESRRAQIKTSAGVVMGTIRYMSPEQTRGLPVDARSDIWSLGVVLYEMVCGRAPFVGDTPSDVIVDVLEHAPPSLRSLSPEMPLALESIVTNALTKDRDKRYQSVTEMLTAMRRLRRRLDRYDELGSGAGSEATSGPGLGSSSSSHGTAHKKLNVRASEIWQGLIRTSYYLKRNKVATLVIMLVIGVILSSLYLVFFRHKSLRSTEPKTTEARLLRTYQITFSSTYDRDPSLSPDGHSVAYSSVRSGSSQIFIKQLTVGGSELQLTSDSQENLEPAWSPDGQRIAFSRNRRGIWITPSLGGVPKQLTEFGSNPSWSRDGEVIAFQTGLAEQSSTIWVVPASGGPARQITKVDQPNGWHTTPSWSPDGKWIAFTTTKAGNSSLWSISVAGDELKRLVPSNFMKAINPVYSPDGETLYFSGFSGATSGLWQIRVSPTTGDSQADPELIMGASLANFLNRFTLSSNGKKIAYSLAQTISNLYSLPISATRDEATGAPVPLTNDTSLRHLAPFFSPDGNKVAFGQLRAGVGEDIFLIDADGKNLTQVTSDPSMDNVPTWFPKGDRLAFLSSRKGHSALWSIALANGKEEFLVDLGPGVDHLRVSPDGRLVAFNTKSGGTTKVSVVPLGGGEARTILTATGSVGYPCWSPDGQLLALEFKRGEESHVAITSASGGPVKQLTFDHGLSFVHSWSPDGDKIAFAGRRNGIWNVYWVSRATGQQKQLTKYTERNSYVRYPAWSPLKNQIVYEYVETTGNIWMLELK
jgi:eukaryotic-like serine/threonine-protein kinase